MILPFKSGCLEIGNRLKGKDDDADDDNANDDADHYDDIDHDDDDDDDAEDGWKIEDGFGPSLDYGRPRRQGSSAAAV